LRQKISEVSSVQPAQINERTANVVVNNHRRTGRQFTGGADKICPESNNLP